MLNMNLLLRFLLILLMIFGNSLLILINGRQNVYRIVPTKSGYVRGIQYFTLFTNRSYVSFKGIPYAAPPINDLRFKPPVAVKSWSGVLDTFIEGNQCLQPREIIDIYNDILPLPYIFGDEDCLYLNVYTPNVLGKFPVMVLIAGGSFSEGSTEYYGPDFIVNEDVTLVTFSHRLGPFGFMSLGTDEYSGNMGIKDVIFVLQWVHKNIAKFGGDKNQITVAGYSAGAAMTHLLLTSGKTKKLFHRAIMMSGSMLNIWGINQRKDHFNEMFEFAHSTDPSVRSYDDLIDFLKNVDATYLLKKFIPTISNLAGLPKHKIADYIWSPTVQTPHIDFFNLIHHEAKYNSSIDTMFGYTSKESIFFVYREIKNPILLKPFNDQYQVQLPLNYDNDIQYDSNGYKYIAKEIRDFYFGIDGIVNEKTMSEYVDLSSDTWMTYAIHLSAKIQALSSTGKTYFYVFSVDDQLNFVKSALNITLPGAAVADDISYLFKVPFPHLYDKVTPDSVARKSIKSMSKLWTNFVKYGNPSFGKLTIKPIRDNEMNFFNITNDGVVLGKNPRDEAMKFWTKIYSENYKGLLKNKILNG